MKYTAERLLERMLAELEFQNDIAMQREKGNHMLQASIKKLLATREPTEEDIAHDERERMWEKARKEQREAVQSEIGVGMTDKVDRMGQDVGRADMADLGRVSIDAAQAQPGYLDRPLTPGAITGTDGSGLTGGAGTQTFDAHLRGGGGSSGTDPDKPQPSQE